MTDMTSTAADIKRQQTEIIVSEEIPDSTRRSGEYRHGATGTGSAMSIGFVQCGQLIRMSNIVVADRGRRKENAQGDTK